MRFTHQSSLNIKAAGRGEPAMKYLSKYLYRGVIQERNIISDENGIITFKYLDAESGQHKTRALPAADFLFFVLKHVLPKRFRRTRDFGFHHGNAKKSLQQIQLVLHHSPPFQKKPEPPKLTCRTCGTVLIVAPPDYSSHIVDMIRNRGSPSCI